MKKVLFLALFAFLFSISYGISQSGARGEKFVGIEGCKCHKTEIMEWQASKHAKAFDKLTIPKNRKEVKKRKRLVSKLNKKLKDNEKLDAKKDYSADKKCLPCHTVGYDERGGFENIDDTPEMAGVGCENCHGPGSLYRVLHKEKDETFTRAEAKGMGAIYGSQDKKVCTTCHENPDSPMRADVDEKYIFDWKEFLSLEKTYHKVYPLKGKH